MQAAGRIGAHQPVFAHFLGPLIAILQRNFQIPPHAVQRAAQIALHGIAQQRLKGRRNGGRRARGDLPRAHPGVAQKRQKRQPEIVRRLPCVGAQRVGGKHLFSVGQPDLDGGIAYVEKQNFGPHKDLLAQTGIPQTVMPQARRYSTVTLLARLRGWSTSLPR